MRQFFFYRDEIHAFRQCQFIIGNQCHDSLVDFYGIDILSVGIDGGQGVIQKVGIDLLLECLKLQAVFPLSGFLQFIDLASTALFYAIYKYCQLKNDYSFGMEHLDIMIRFYEKNAEMFRCACGLFCRIDGEDGGEFSISGRPVPDLNAQKGIRPILNSYMAANAQAIAEFAKRAGEQEIASKYEQEAERIRGLMLKLLWDGTFFKAAHGEDVDNLPDVRELPAEQNAKEFQGYIPWCFDIVPQGQGYEKAFEELKDEKGFKNRYGLTTAEQRYDCIQRIMIIKCIFIFEEGFDQKGL